MDNTSKADYMCWGKVLWCLRLPTSLQDIFGLFNWHILSWIVIHVIVIIIIIIIIITCRIFLCHLVQYPPAITFRLPMRANFRLPKRAHFMLDLLFFTCIMIWPENTANFEQG
jgi:hypothetical protein